MRTEEEMYRLILGVAKADARVRAVVLNGSRANPNAPKDKYQDYDIVYVVREFDSFLADHSWLDVFGQRLIMQMPETMRDPSGAGHFNWMMLFTDGNRLDLTLIPIEKLELLGNDSLSVLLLDKDGMFPPFPESSDKGYWEQPPSELFYLSCCNNFWWCMQNVAKGIAREELPYAMMMYHGIVREELHDMLAWYIGAQNGFSITAGKMGKYFEHFLPAQMYRQYCATYSGCGDSDMWDSLFAMCGLFHTAALAVGQHLDIGYKQEEEDGIREYLANVKNDAYALGEF